MKKEWCQEKRVEITQSGSEIKSRRYRCPRCKKRFMTSIENCVGDLSFTQACCWWEYLPVHKRILK